jgi:prevent-host-death family protein
MQTVGVFEAKTHFSEIMARVAKGAEFVVTRHGRPLAKISRATASDQALIDRSIDGILNFPRGSVSRKEVLGFIREGRKY